MNVRKYIFTSFCLLLFTFLFAENNMEVMAELTGEHPRSQFGFCVTALDFNGDGFDDLAVTAYKWDPTYAGWPASAAPWDKIYMYFGSEENFGDSLIFSISNYDSLRSGFMVENLGDMNNDGFEDLGYLTYYVGSLGEFFNVNILLGNDIMDSIPDHTIVFSYEDMFSSDHAPYIMHLGDINGDGYDDAGISASRRINEDDELDFIYLIYGNEFQPHYLCRFDTYIYPTSIYGVGDVNNDGFDDFTIGSSENGIMSKYLYFGGVTNDSIPDLVLSDLVPNPYYGITGGVALGDWNGDGIDDFNAGVDVNGTDIWFGSETNLQQSMHLDYIGWVYYRQYGYGDINGDGYNDFVSGNDGGLAGLDGHTYLYLGCQNGTCDYTITGTYGINLGWSVTVGDFNNDGFDDIAAGGKGNGASGLNDSWCGKVFVYAGNADLEEADPNVSEESDTIPKHDVVFNAYPNPFNPTVNFEIKAEGYENLQIEIFNIKGQKVETLPVSFSQGHTISITWNSEDQASGVYLCKLVNVETKKQLAVQKITLLK